MVAATGARIALAGNDLRGAREHAARSYRAAVGTQDLPVLAQVSAVMAELALAIGQPERAAELLGAGAAVRGARDPTDPTELRLGPVLGAALGEDRFQAAYASGSGLDRPAAVECLDPATLA
jgi:hypothetical protein